MGPLLIIIQTTTGNRFGGYTSKSWTKQSSYNWPGDELAFIFSLDLKIKFEIKKPSEAVGQYKDYGPILAMDIALKSLLVVYIILLVIIEFQTLTRE